MINEEVRSKFFASNEHDRRLLIFCLANAGYYEEAKELELQAASIKEEVRRTPERPETSVFKQGDIVQHKTSKELAVVTKCYCHDGTDYLCVSKGIDIECTLSDVCFELCCLTD